VQEVALVADHVSIDVPPLGTVLGLPLSVTAGAGMVTVMVADWVALPPEPTHVTLKVVFALRAPVDCDPLVVSGPLHAPDAVQELALVEDQVKVELPPLATVVGLALTVTVGVGVMTVTVADCAALPPAPVQVNV
jgi:hypothetical protein